MPKPPNRILRTFAVVMTLAAMVTWPINQVGALPPSGDGGEIVRPPVSPTCTDIFNCRLPQEIRNTSNFLLQRKYGLPYTADPRWPGTPTGEVLRLNVVSQALGYLNLYRATRLTAYKQEAVGRLNYVLSLGDQALGYGPRDGMTGYMFLDAWKLTGDARYKTAGLHVADTCLTNRDYDMQMNGGLMCSLNLGLAYQITGNTVYRDMSRTVVQRTAPKQFPDGAFPHEPSQASGENTSYTAWMSTELFHLRQLDPQDPNLDFLLAKNINFLVKRVNSDGTLNYQDAYGTYYADPGNADSRYWTNELGVVSYDLYAGSRKTEAGKVLSFLFKQRMIGEDYGGYPDKYAGVDPTNIWTTGRPSVLRTSLIFWYLTMFRLAAASCSSGPTVNCTVTSANCDPLYQQLGLCDQDLPGVQTCLNGIYSSCIDLQQAAYRVNQACTVENYCQDDGNQACYYACTHFGTKVCVGSTCGQQCYDLDDQASGFPDCTSTCYDNQSCSTNTQPAWSNSDGGEICQLPRSPAG
ncbi:MAG: hypothetical protein AAB402_03805 [Patescibacteria group bacterium]